MLRLAWPKPLHKLFGCRELVTDLPYCSSAQPPLMPYAFLLRRGNAKSAPWSSRVA